MKNITRVFVYGTLKPGGRYHQRFCGGFNFEIRETKVSGRLFDFPQQGYPGAQEDEAQWIRGVLLTFSHPEEVVLSKLDELEGYDAKRPAHLNEYYRKAVTVYDLKGSAFLKQAWCYFMEPQVIEKLKGVHLPDGEWKG